MLLPGAPALWEYIPIGCIMRNALWERHTCWRRSLLYCGYIMRHTFGCFWKPATLASVCETLQPLFCTVGWCYFSFNNVSPPDHFHSTIPQTQLPPSHIPRDPPSPSSRCRSSDLCHFHDVTSHTHGYNLVADDCFVRRHIGTPLRHTSETGSSWRGNKTTATHAGVSERLEFRFCIVTLKDQQETSHKLKDS
jgi:hypothetical protein